MNKLKRTKVFLAPHKNLFRIEGRSRHNIEHTNQSKIAARVKELRKNSKFEQTK